MSLSKVGGILSAGLNGINYPVTAVEYLVVAGGGGGGIRGAGGRAGRPRRASHRPHPETGLGRLGHRRRVHLQAEGAAIDLRNPQIDQIDQLFAKAALVQGFLGKAESLVGFRREGLVRQAKCGHKRFPVKGEGTRNEISAWRV